MKLYLAHGVSAEALARVKRLIEASSMRDIELQGITIDIERDDATWCDGTRPEDTALLYAVQREISGENESPEGYGTTAFGITYPLGKSCPDCGVFPGNQHKNGCDVEQCPVCGGQSISCECAEDVHFPRLLWTGEWPGKMECREFGWYVKMVPGKGWQLCDQDDHQASEDLNRLHYCAVWSKAQARFILPPDAG